MKFMYTGQLAIKDADLVIAGIFKPNQVISKGTIFEVPDDNKNLIQRVLLGGNYIEYKEPKKVVLPKEDKKEGNNNNEEEEDK